MSSDEAERERIVEAVRQTARANDGRPVGRQRFEELTGIKEAHWSGRFWVRWSDLVREAGFEPNEMNARIDDDEVLAKVADLVLKLDKFPTTAEMRLAKRQDDMFPNKNLVRRFGGTADLAEALVDLVRRRGLDDRIVDHCRAKLASLPQRSATSPDDGESTLIPGHVYLMKSGRYYKIGRSQAVGRRHYELNIQLPEELQVIHTLETDDTVGLEAYWHQRFAERRVRGEWFSLTKADVRAFKWRGKRM